MTEMNLSHSLKTRLPTNVNIKLFHFFHFFFKYIITGLEEDRILTKINLNSIIYFHKTNKRTLGQKKQHYTIFYSIFLKKM